MFPIFNVYNQIVTAPPQKVGSFDAICIAATEKGTTLFAKSKIEQQIK